MPHQIILELRLGWGLGIPHRSAYNCFQETTGEMQCQYTGAVCAGIRDRQPSQNGIINPNENGL